MTKVGPISMLAAWGASRIALGVAGSCQDAKAISRKASTCKLNISYLQICTSKVTVVS